MQNPVMDQECSEAAPNSPRSRRAGHGRTRPVETVWSQPQLWDSTEVVLETRMVVDGPGGTFVASVAALDFWSGDAIALEVRTGMRFPSEVHLALLWFEERMLAYSASVAPF